MIDLQAVENNLSKSKIRILTLPEIDCKKFLLDKNIFAKKKLKFFIEIVIFETRKGKNSETEQTWGSRLECLNISTNWMKIVQDS